MEECTYCGVDGADLACDECGDVFCRSCIVDGLCPICGGREGEDSEEALLNGGSLDNAA